MSKIIHNEQLDIRPDVCSSGQSVIMAVLGLKIKTYFQWGGNPAPNTDEILQELPPNTTIKNLYPDNSLFLWNVQCEMNGVLYTAGSDYLAHALADIWISLTIVKMKEELNSLKND